MKRKAEGETVRARTWVRNQAVSSPTTEEAKTTTLASPRTRVQQNTPRFAHTGKRNHGKLEKERTSIAQHTVIIEAQQH